MFLADFSQAIHHTARRGSACTPSKHSSAVNTERSVQPVGPRALPSLDARSNASEMESVVLPREKEKESVPAEQQSKQAQRRRRKTTDPVELSSWWSLSLGRQSEALPDAILASAAIRLARLRLVTAPLLHSHPPSYTKGTAASKQTCCTKKPPCQPVYAAPLCGAVRLSS